jgi:hypothetical protein
MQHRSIPVQRTDPIVGPEVVEGLRTWALVAIFLALGVTLLLGILATREGAGITPDSVQYLSAAHHVAQGDGVRTSVTELTETDPDIPLGPWPPLYPVVLGGLIYAGVSPLDAPRYVNLVCLALGVLALAWIGHLTAGPGAVAPTVLLHSLLFYPIMLSSFVWSESLYILLSLASLGFFGLGLRREHGLAWEMILAGTLAGLTMLTRYIGFTLIGTSIVALWLLLMHRPLRILGRNLLAFSVPAVGLNLLWLVRNRFLTGHFFGEGRPDAWFAWDRILADMMRTLFVDWVTPIARYGGWWSLVGMAAGVVGAIILMVIVARRLPNAPVSMTARRTGLGLVLWIYLVSFVLAMILLSRQVGFDPINTRYLAPVYPILMILVVYAFRALINSDRRQPLWNREREFFLGAVLLLAIPQLASTGILLTTVGTETRTVTGPYWTSTQWDDLRWDYDPGLARIESLAGAEGIVISNVWDLIGIRTGLSTKTLPETEWEGYPNRFWDYPGALIAVHSELRRYRATAEDLHHLVEQTGRLAHLGDTGSWALFRILPEMDGAS